MSWYQLLAIQQQQAEQARWEAQRIPSACPRCGEPLIPGPTPGTLFCKFDGFEYPRDGKQI